MDANTEAEAASTHHAKDWLTMNGAAVYVIL
jgi:hypothetical protein